MDTRKFIDLSLREVCSYMNIGNKAKRTVVPAEIYLVWICKDADNNKGIFAVKDTNYLFEVTSIHNGNEAFILDVYEKRDKVNIENVSL